MLNRSLVLFLWVSSLSVLCVSIGVKRKAPDGQLYVFAKLGKCVSVESEEQCPVSWPLSDLYSKMYKRNNRFVNSSAESYRILGVREKCIEVVNKILCSQFTPRCIPEGLDFGDVLNECWNLENSCSEDLVNELEKRGFCDNLLTGKVSNAGQCVVVSTPIRGVCPQPRFKMFSPSLAPYRKLSESLLPEAYEMLENLRYDDGERVFTSDCLSQFKEIDCSPLYCSADEKALLANYDQEDCYNIVQECFDDVLSKASLVPSLHKLADSWRTTLKALCDTYPNASTAQLQAEPPIIKPVKPEKDGEDLSPSLLGDL